MMACWPLIEFALRAPERSGCSVQPGLALRSEIRVSASLAATIISGAIAIIVAFLSYFLTKQKEREADWRKVKLDLYREYVNAVAGIVEARLTPESEVRYHDAFNTIGLVASPTVLAAVQAFQAEISPANSARTLASHDDKYSRMINALRQDLTRRRWPSRCTLSFT
jgi:hypothetical protein